MDLLPPLVSSDPLITFHQWLGEAATSEPNDPNAAALATASVEGQPSVRMVLVKRVDARGFCFFTNSESAKGQDLAVNPKAALCFHWKTLRRQVRVEGSVGRLAENEVDEYFHSRSRRSQLGAAVSQQSRVLPARHVLEEQLNNFEQNHPGEVPRPAYWRGYCVAAERIEFWMDGADRLHDRILFTRAEPGWLLSRLYP
jgi:pyridoxamine 5'-phosphate oxidase